MDLGIKGRSGIVTAASKGLGRGCAEALAEAGVALTLNARGAEALEATAAEIREKYGVTVTTVAGDITTEAVRAGDPAQAAIQLVSLFFMLAFPATAVFGVGLLLFRAGRWLAARFPRRPLKVPS